MAAGATAIPSPAMPGIPRTCLEPPGSIATDPLNRLDPPLSIALVRPQHAFRIEHANGQAVAHTYLRRDKDEARQVRSAA